MTKNEQMLAPKTGVLIGIIAIAALLRVFLSEYPNIAPVAAMALFGGAYFRNKAQAFLIPLLLMLFSDLVLEAAYWAGIREYSGIHNGMTFVYGAFLLMVMVGMLLRKKFNPLTIVGASLVSSTLFFLITNFGVWLLDAGMQFPLTFVGLIACYEFAIPFFDKTVFSDLAFVTIFFGGFELVKRYYPQLALAKAS